MCQCVNVCLGLCVFVCSAGTALPLSVSSSLQPPLAQSRRHTHTHTQSLDHNAIDTVRALLVDHSHSCHTSHRRADGGRCHYGHTIGNLFISIIISFKFHLIIINTLHRDHRLCHKSFNLFVGLRPAMQSQHGQMRMPTELADHVVIADSLPQSQGAR